MNNIKKYKRVDKFFPWYRKVPNTYIGPNKLLFKVNKSKKAIHVDDLYNQYPYSLCNLTDKGQKNQKYFEHQDSELINYIKQRDIRFRWKEKKRKARQKKRYQRSRERERNKFQRNNKRNKNRKYKKKEVKRVLKNNKKNVKKKKVKRILKKKKIIKRNKKWEILRNKELKLKRYNKKIEKLRVILYRKAIAESRIEDMQEITSDFIIRLKKL